MADTEYRRLIQAARDKALLGFGAVLQRAIRDADGVLGDALAVASSGPQHTTLTAVRHFLRQEGNALLKRVDTRYHTYLERALQTMYTDLRPGMRQMSADELSLVDDEAVNVQIEVGRLAQRIREENEEAIGRLNVIIANMHGEIEARERENPFRPYPIARAVFEGVRESMGDEVRVKALFEHLAQALIPHLEGFYRSIREVFESSGVRGKFIAQRSRAAHHQRYFGAPSLPADMAAAPHAANVMSGLNRVLETLQQGGLSGGAGAIGGNGGGLGTEPTMQELLQAIFGASQNAMPTAPRQAPGSKLIEQLEAYQKTTVLEDREAAFGADASGLRARLDLEHASVAERTTVEVVTTLFEIILGDAQIPSAVRADIARLQVPVLKAALLDPGLLHDEDHPARRLLNRLGSAAAGTDSGTDTGAALAAEITRVVGKVLAEFHTDSSAFANNLADFERFLGGLLREEDGTSAAASEAVEAAEKYSVLLSNTTRTLCDVLLPLNIDKRVSDFVIAVWPHVLVQAAWQDVRNGGDLCEQYRQVLPELIWSIQERGPQERAVLVKLLPNLVRRLRAALEMIELPQDDLQAILDLLVGLHTQVLRGSGGGGASARAPRLKAGLEELRQQFAPLAIRWEHVSWTLPEPPHARESAVEDVFAQLGVEAELNLLASTAASAADRDFLTQTYLLGTRVELRSGEPSRARLIWVSTHRSLYLFRDDAGRLAVYSAAALLEALSAQRIVPLEYAPIFERAVESLLFGAGRLAV